MKQARTRALSPSEKSLLSQARQTLREERKPRRNPKHAYVGTVTAAKGHLLLGGVKTHRSSPFATYNEAMDWISVIVEGNEKAERKVDRYWVSEVGKKPSSSFLNPRKTKSRFRHEKLRSSKGLHHFRTVTIGKHRIIIGCPFAHHGGRCPVGMVASSILHPKREARSNPRLRRELVRMGKLVELRYYRDHGKTPGYYKHEFKKKPTVYWDRQRNQIIAG